MTVDELRLPELADPYGAALGQCLEWAFQEYDVCGALLAGTIWRGCHDARSDLDIHILHRGGFRQRVQRFFLGVPCEIFVNPPDKIPSYFQEDLEDRRPISQHMFATGWILFDPEAYVARHVEAARMALQTPPNLVPLDVSAKYSAATEFEDLLDLSERDPEAAQVLLGAVVAHLLMIHVESLQAWKPRNKDLMSVAKELDPIAAELAKRASAPLPLEQRLAAARDLCLRVTGADGFFEWSSPPEQVC